jgi:hypothetical protein
MAHQPVNNCALATLTHRQSGGSGVPLTIDLYFETSLGWNQPAIDLFAAVVQQAWEDNLQLRVPPDYELVEIHCRDLEAEFAAARTLTPNLAGTNVSTLFASVSLSAVVFWLAGSPPPRRTFIHWPFINDADVDTEGQITPTFRNDLAISFNAFIDQIETGPPVTAQAAVSRYSGFDLVAKPNGTVVKKPRRRMPSAVTSGVGAADVREIVGSQRDRRF